MGPQHTHRWTRFEYRRRRTPAPVLILVLATCAALLAWAPAAEAHAELVGIDVRHLGDEGSGGIELTLRFSEPVDPGFSRLTLVGQDGGRLEVRSVGIDPGRRRMVARVPFTPAGTYTVGWFVRSRDGDSSNGSTELAIEHDATSTGTLPPVNARDPAWQPPMTWRMTVVSALVRWLSYIGAALVTGALAFRLFTWPAIRPPRGHLSGTLGRPPGFQGLVLGGLGTLFFAGFLLLLLQASFLQLTTLQPVDAASPIPLDPEGLQRAPAAAAVGRILTTYAGTVWIIRMAVIAFLALMVWRTSRRDRHDETGLWAALIGAAGLLLTLSLTSHAAFVPETSAGAAAAVAMDWSHLAAMSLWLGGLPPLLLALSALDRDSGAAPGARSRLLERFSVVALGSVAYLGVSGLSSTYVQVGDPALLVRTLYGITLDVKLALVAVVVAFGALSRYVLIPRAKRQGNPAGFYYSLPAEIAVGAVLLFSVALLAAQGAAATAWPAHQALGVALDRQLADTRLLLRITPGEAGENRLALDVTDRRLGAWRDAGTVRVSLAAPGGVREMRTSRLTFENTFTERYVVPEIVAMPEGPCTVRARLERPGYAPLEVEFQTRMGPRAPPARD